jgi:hypothetical protein
VYQEDDKSLSRSLQKTNRNSSPFKRDVSPTASYQQLPSNPLRIDINTSRSYSKSPMPKSRTQEVFDRNPPLIMNSTNVMPNTPREVSPGRHLSIFQTGRSSIGSGHLNNGTVKIFAELPDNNTDKEQTFIAKSPVQVMSKPIAPINLSEVHINSPRNSVGNTTQDFPTVTARKGGVRRSHLSQSVTYTPKVSKMSIFEDQAVARLRDTKEASTPNKTNLEYPSSQQLINKASVSSRKDLRAESSMELLLPDRQRFIDGPIFPLDSAKNNTSKSEFAPDVFQKLRLLEEEVVKLKAANEQKQLELKALTFKPNTPSHTSGAENQLLRQDNLRLHEENLRMKARIAELEFLAFGRKAHPTSELDLSTKIIVLEQENREVKQRYENLKKIANSATFDDLEKLMRKIQEMEGYIKSLKRKNELLEAQINS